MKQATFTHESVARYTCVELVQRGADFRCTKTANGWEIEVYSDPTLIPATPPTPDDNPDQ